MRENYKINAPVGTITLKLETDVIETLEVMEKHVELPMNELVNTAVKRFISSHNDFLPTEFREERRRRRTTAAK
jgi:hypothetical protein